MSRVLLTGLETREEICRRQWTIIYTIYEYFHAFIDSKKRKRWYLSWCLSFINTLTTSHCIFKENKHNNSPRSSFPPPQY